MGSNAYAVTHERDGSFQLRSTDPDRLIARIAPFCDRSAQIIGWRLKPVVVLQGATSRLWSSPAEAIAATKLLTPAKAKAAVRAAEVASNAAFQTTNIFGEQQ